jgi:hypothetical protein
VDGNSAGKCTDAAPCGKHGFSESFSRRGFRKGIARIVRFSEKELKFLGKIDKLITI